MRVVLTWVGGCSVDEPLETRLGSQARLFSFRGLFLWDWQNLIF